jgi:RNA polymerase sigma factor (sigma-70 family)
VGHLSDQELLRRFLSGRDEAAFAALVERHGPMVLGLCRRVLRQEQDAEDACQAAFLVLARKAGSIRKRTSLGCWLHGVAYRLARKAKEGGARRRDRELRAPAASPPDPAAEANWREVQAALDEELQRLPERYRAPLVLCYLQGQARDEVAGRLGLPLSTLRGRLEQGRDLLRARLARRGVTLSAALLVPALAEGAAAAVLPAPLVVAAVRHSLLFTTGRAAASPATVLAEGALKTMLLHRFTKLAGALLLLAGLAAGAGGWLLSAGQAGPAELSERAAPPAKPGANVKPEPPAREGEEPTVTVQGRVLGPDGRPVAKARIYVPTGPAAPRGRPTKGDLVERGASGADGRFRFTLPRRDAGAGQQVVAAATGFGLAWGDLPQGEGARDLTLRLVKDQPIRGRLLSTEGKALRGVAVRVTAVATVPDGLDKFLAAWKRELGRVKGGMQMLSGSPHKALRTNPTDADGRFEVLGVGAERLALVELSGAGVVSTRFLVASRPGLDTKVINQAVLDRIPPEVRRVGQVPPLLYGPSFDHVVETGREIEGTVREAGTRRPLAGVRVLTGAPVHPVTAVSDSKGRYRLVGAKRAKEHWLQFTPGPGGTLLTRSVRAAESEEAGPLRVDVELARGVVVTGRVVDPTTGKGVSSQVHFAPLPGNAHAKKAAAAGDQYSSPVATDAEGRFRLVTIPGLGVLLAQARASVWRVSGVPVIPYRRATFTPADAKRVKETKLPGGTRLFAVAGGGFEALDVHNACRVLELPEGPGPVNSDLTVDPGKTLQVQVRGPDGKPVPGAVVAGLADLPVSAVPLKGDSCTLYALDPRHPREVVFLHPGRKLAGSAQVRGDEKQPLTVRLVAAGTVHGTVVDRDGDPLVGAEVRPVYTSRTADLLTRHLSGLSPRTDKGGRFRVEGLVPDLPFRLEFVKGRQRVLGEAPKGGHKVAPGGVVDLGRLQATNPKR